MAHIAVHFSGPHFQNFGSFFSGAAHFVSDFFFAMRASSFLRDVFPLAFGIHGLGTITLDTRFHRDRVHAARSYGGDFEVLLPRRQQRVSWSRTGAERRFADRARIPSTSARGSHSFEFCVRWSGFAAPHAPDDHLQ